jgi:DNA-directed RNA polymerase alpha subunit
MSERDASTLLSQIENSEEELFNLRNKFSKDLKEVLSQKIIKLKKSRRGFQSNSYSNTDLSKNN